MSAPPCGAECSCSSFFLAASVVGLGVAAEEAVAALDALLSVGAGWQPLKINVARYLAGGAEFGPFVSRNLTPDANGNPAGLTFAQFLSVLRTGVDLHDAKFPTPFPSPLLQVMPWPAYKNLTDFDIRAIYEYLSRVPSKP